MDDEDEVNEAEHAALLKHLAEFDRWESMSDAEREREISAVLRRS